jgi:hypothetical protein
LAEQKIRGFGVFKVLGVWIAWGFFFRPHFARPEPVIFWLSKKYAASGCSKCSGLRIA